MNNRPGGGRWPLVKRLRTLQVTAAGSTPRAATLDLPYKLSLYPAPLELTTGSRIGQLCRVSILSISLFDLETSSCPLLIHSFELTL